MSTGNSLQVLDDVIVLRLVQTDAGVDGTLRATLLLGQLNDMVLLYVGVNRHNLGH